MRIPNNILDCVCFLGVKLSGGAEADKFHCLGTAFLIVIEESGLLFSYLVTARHVLDEAKRGGYQNLTARINKHDGTAESLELPDAWIKWTSPATDVAVLMFGLDLNIFDLKAMPIRMFADAATIARHGIGPGDDLFTVGLFSLRTGKQRIIPIVRSGILAAMPSETEPFTKDGEPYHAYLIEMRSIGGLSGSPVFAYIDINRRVVEAEIPKGRDWMIVCIGLIRGHWDLERELIDNVQIPSTSDVRLGFSKGENLNTGIAVVTPSQYVLGILNNPKLQTQRKNLVAIHEKKDEPTEDSAAQQAHKVFASDQFQDVLKRAGGKASEPESEETQTSE